MAMMRAQVFQNAVCNWRCWWCYVPFELLSGSPKHSAMLAAGQLVDSYLQVGTGRRCSICPAASRTWCPNGCCGPFGAWTSGT